MKDFMLIAYKESIKAYKKREIPVGAIIVKNNKVIARAHNDRQTRYNVLGHAEIKTILKAEKKIKDWRLNGCDMYVTLEPCDLCEKIIKEARLDNVYYLLKSNSQEHMFVQTNNCDELLKNYQKILQKFFKELR